MRRNLDIQKLVLTSILLAIVIVLQLFAAVVKIGVFQVSLVLIPITIGSILLGPKTGAFLGFIFGVIVIATGDAAVFMSYGGLATVLIVLLKGTIAGFASGFVYDLIKKINKNKNDIIPCITASIVAPIVNTGVFALGTMIFLRPALTDAAQGENGIVYLFTIMIGFNFLIELLITSLLSPAIVRIVSIGKERFNFKKEN